MDDNITNDIINLYKEKNWRNIVEKYHDHPERNKLLWVYPGEENFEFIANCLKELKCDRVLSVGCGSGLLEWMVTEATGFPVSGIEVDGAWWNCKYAPPTFIPLLFTTSKLEKDILNILGQHSLALLFCYFNNRPAFEEYIKHFKGNVLIIIGPGDGRGVHTDPKPFGDVNNNWDLFKWQEVRNSKDFIAFYCKKNIIPINK
ncbi:hypothetical protein K1T71_006491 [Dendrolimus kikuchii]|uniref:Uncharacterized protein n=1 Tax=Dendrolimus kikuchii TaxID=765133 RepID=A0ACC1D168_9NEOP|nr:hypothetical protein K1T71_006491 [Dendrolimus kikuchii]